MQLSELTCKDSLVFNNNDMLKKLKNIFAVSTESKSLGNKFRQKRMRFFRKRMNRLRMPLKILDVGGNESFWVNAEMHNKKNVEIVILNQHKTETHYPNIKSAQGDARKLTQYNDGSFDVVFSNSVIEHLYTKKNQKKMADEIQRVGRYHFVQTPNKYFIIEPHYLLPWFQFLPKSLRYFILTRTPLSRLKKWDKAHAKQYLEEIRLISCQEMKELFPESKIYVERFMGLRKSFTAHNLP